MEGLKRTAAPGLFPVVPVSSVSLLYFPVAFRHQQTFQVPFTNPLAWCQHERSGGILPQMSYLRDRTHANTVVRHSMTGRPSKPCVLLLTGHACGLTDPVAGSTCFRRSRLLNPPVRSRRCTFGYRVSTGRPLITPPAPDRLHACPVKTVSANKAHVRASFPNT